MEVSFYSSVIHVCPKDSDGLAYSVDSAQTEMEVSFYSSVIHVCPKDSDGLAYSVDSDQTAKWKFLFTVQLYMYVQKIQMDWLTV